MIGKSTKYRIKGFGGNTLDPDSLNRFISKFTITDSCWNWNGFKDKDGYGVFKFKKHTYRAHRISWEYYNNDVIPDGLLVCHSCDNPSCINPDHLFLGTAIDNNRDARDKKRNYIGMKNGRAKLTDAQVLEIRSRKKYWGCQTEWGKEYGVSQVLIGRIINNRNWVK